MDVQVGLALHWWKSLQQRRVNEIYIIKVRWGRTDKVIHMYISDYQVYSMKISAWSNRWTQHSILPMIEPGLISRTNLTPWSPHSKPTMKRSCSYNFIFTCFSVQSLHICRKIEPIQRLIILIWKFAVIRRNSFHYFCDFLVL